MCEWKFIVLHRFHGAAHQVFVSNTTFTGLFTSKAGLNPLNQVFVSNDLSKYPNAVKQFMRLNPLKMSSAHV